MSSKKYQNYLRDLIYLIKERQSLLDSDQSKDDFKSGIKQGYHEILDIIQNQAISFQIDLSEVGFMDFDKFRETGLK